MNGQPLPAIGRAQIRIPFKARLASAMQALGQLFTPDRSKPVVAMLEGLFPGSKGEIPSRTTADYLRAYSAMPWLRVCCDVISDSTSSAIWHVQSVRRAGRPVRERRLQRAKSVERTALESRLRAQGELQDLPDHPMTHLLNEGNGFLTGMMIRKLIRIYIELVGEAFLMLERDGLGVPIAWWPLPPNWIANTPTPARQTYQMSYRGWNQEIPASEIVWALKPDPFFPYGRGSGTAHSLADELETGEFASRHVKNFFLHDARPPIVIYGKGIDETNTERLEQRWMEKSSGFWNKWKPFFLSAAEDAEVHIQELKHDFENMQLVELMAHERDTVQQVFGIPPEKLGILSNSNRATIDGSDLVMAKNVVVPRLEFERELYQFRVALLYDDKLVITYDSPVQEDKAHQLEVAKAAPWALKRNEWRSMAGFEPDAENGDQYYVPVTLIPENSDGAPLALGAGSSATKALRGGRGESYRMLHALADRNAPKLRKGFLQAARVLQRATPSALIEEALISRQASTIDIAPFRDALRESMRTVLQKIALAGGRAAAEDLQSALRQRGARRTKQVDLDFDRIDEIGARWAEQYAAELVTLVGQYTKNAIGLAIAEGMEGARDVRATAREIAGILREGGLGLDERRMSALLQFRQQLIEQGVEPAAVAQRATKYADALLRQRAVTIARTETIRASNRSQGIAWEEASKQGLFDRDAVQRVWIATPDDRLDPVCEGLDGEAVGMDESFSSGDFEPPAHPSCRCALRLSFS